MFRKLLLLLPAVLLIALVLAPMGAAAGPGVAGHTTGLDATLPVHPYLQYGAQVEPDKRVRVLVRKADGHLEDRDDEDSEVSEGEHFPLVRSKVLELPLRKVVKLANKPGVEYISPDAPVYPTSLDASKLKTVYEQVIGTPNVWNASGGLSATGNGVTVAVLDSGVNKSHPDLGGGQSVTCIKVSLNATGCGDENGHGTHVIGIIKGKDAYGRYIGVAPDARILSLKITDDTGAATESDVIRGLQWVNDNRASYNIRVVNLSFGAAVAQSYQTSAVAAAVETLWLNGIVVVAASGNRGGELNQTWYAPGNDPFVITVGALDDNQTVDTNDDSLAYFSSRGLTQDGFYKPDIVAPGRKIVAPLASSSVTLATQFPDRIVDTNYIRLSGTSMAAPVVSGVVALLLERYPNLTPNQVKWLLQQTASAYPGKLDSAGVVHPLKAMQVAALSTLGQANQGLTVNPAVHVNGGGTSSTQAYWNGAYWNGAYWEGAYWEGAYWNGAAKLD